MRFSSQAWCELVFQLLSCVGPRERLGGLVLSGHEVENGVFKLFEASEMVGLQELALENTKPDFNLIQPGSIDRQPIELHRQLSMRFRRQFGGPTWELLGCMGGTIIKDESYGSRTPRWCASATMIVSKKARKSMKRLRAWH